MTAQVVPVSRLSSRAQSVLIVTRLIFARLTTVPFGDIRTDRSHRPVKLVRQPNGSLVLREPCCVVPTQIAGKKRKTIHFHPPERISSEFHRHRFQPLLKFHIFPSFHATRNTQHVPRPSRPPHHRPHSRHDS